VKLEAKVAIVTGGSQGIGRATVERFAREGARVAIWDVDTDKGETLVREFREREVDARFFRVDVTSTASVEDAAHKTNDAFGALHILVNNAGIVKDSTLLKMEETDFDAVIGVNLKGVFNCTRAVARIMSDQAKTDQADRSILNASSVVALYGNFGQTNYVATKAGVIGMTRTWARELGRKGIRVNAVAPGFIATQMVKTIPEAVRDKLLERVPLGRLGDPAEVASVYAFLASEDARYVTGTVISVDGGAVI